jgi:DNA polymerase III epsilon subunit family exonuclease
MNHSKFIVVDIETTGLNLNTSEIIEIGCVLFKFNNKKLMYEIEEEFEIKIKPDHIETADPRSLKINKYSELDWKNAVSLKDGLKIFSKKSKDRVMIGHNVGFDFYFLNYFLLKCKLKNNLHYHLLDTLSMAYVKLKDNKDAKRLSLQYLCDYFGIENKKAHSALSDAKATYELFLKIID